ncbi:MULTISPECIES: acyl carrier protein [Stutzerimonas]|uniref:acyl carrier protein n=1 Tax=Stutzerimonas TaxID=2901164 RepID=UPI0004282011|nr:MULTISPECIES: acyl carrier protein [Stutzerimonas]MCF6782804.1 acyl carrier protein [Stutzerimonas stutzeri]MCF6805909.1 acyl carrier protein [Stutzerimonas stutzeri]
MTEADVLKELTAVFHDVFDDDSIVLSPEMTANDIDGWDSQTHVMLTVAAEQRFGIKFRTAELESLRNVGHFAEVISKKLEAR